jgi:hypothetical protein
MSHSDYSGGYVYERGVINPGDEFTGSTLTSVATDDKSGKAHNKRPNIYAVFEDAHVETYKEKEKTNDKEKLQPY